VDEHLFRLFYGAEGGALTCIATAFSLLGEGWIMLAILPLLASRRHRAPALALTCVLVVTAASVAALKLLVHRVRPCNALVGVQCLWGSAPTDFSFPSGHAAGSFAFTAFVGTVVSSSAREWVPQRAKIAICSACLLAATCIALSRVYLGVHFPGDVAAGSCLGAAIGLAGALAYLRTGSLGAADSPSSTRTPR
jgi:undecaprenyl-diphosphatase